MECDFIPINYDSFDFEDENYIQITGRTSNGEQICLIDKYTPNFYIILKKETNEKQITEIIEYIKNKKFEKNNKNIQITEIKLEKKNFLEKEFNVLRIFTKNHKDLHDIASQIGENEFILNRREYDINIITKYIMEREIEPLNFYKTNITPLDQEDLGGIIRILDYKSIFYLQNFKKIDHLKYEPKVLAYDIETEDLEIGKNKILMISLYSKNFKKVLTSQKTQTRLDYVEEFDSEKEMIEGFVKHIKEFSPDILCGYFSDRFDLPYIKSRAKKNKLLLNIGLDNSEPASSRGKIQFTKINGIVHVDLYRFISSVFSQYLQTESLSLNEVAKELIGEEKNEFDFNKLKKMSEKDWNTFFEYNLQDSKITYNLFNSIWADMYEFTQIVKEPLSNISRSTMATNCENYILHNLKRFNEIAEKRPNNENIADRINEGKYEGAYVYEPKPNIYENIVFFDFTSMYGSVIVTYNLSKSTFDGEKFIKDKKGFFPTLLEEIIQKRKIYKKEYYQNKNNLTKARSNAYKLLANASYGYLGFSGARYYSRESAQATTKLAKENILLTIEKIKKKGFEIIYSDTDSIAFLSGEKNKEEIFELLKILNDDLPGIMELDFEDFYKRGIFVSKRDNLSGAKKKYALLKENGKLKIRGFETVRRDWCLLARNLQREILEQVLKEGTSNKALETFQRTLDKLNNRQIDKKDLMIKVQLKKEIDNYSSINPHVIAAKKMKKNGINISPGMLIEYYIGETTKKTKKIGDKVFLYEENTNYDIEYYLNNQIIPSVESIFEVLNIDIKQKINKQKSLSDF